MSAHSPPASRSRILDAAWQVIRAKGLAHATTRQIAAAAQMSEGALYRHFRDRDELFLSVMRECLPRFTQVLGDLQARAGQGTVDANLEAFVLDALRFLDEIVPVIASLFAEPRLLGGYADLLGTTGGLHEAHRGLAAYIEAEQRLGRVGPHASPAGAAMLVLGACHQHAFLTHLVGSARAADLVAPPLVARELVNGLMLGLAPREPVP